MLKKPNAIPEVTGLLVIHLLLPQKQQLHLQVKFRAITAKIAPTKKFVVHARTELSYPSVLHSFSSLNPMHCGREKCVAKQKATYKSVNHKAGAFQKGHRRNMVIRRKYC
jgi:hypothetical protein